MTSPEQTPSPRDDNEPELADIFEFTDEVFADMDWVGAPAVKFDYAELLQVNQGFERQAQQVQALPMLVNKVGAPFQVADDWNEVPGIRNSAWSQDDQKLLSRVFACCLKALENDGQNYTEFLRRCNILPYTGDGVEIVEGQNRSIGEGYWNSKTQTLHINPSCLPDFVNVVAIALHETEHGTQGDRDSFDVQYRCTVEVRTHAATAERLRHLASIVVENTELSEVERRFWSRSFIEQAELQDLGAQSYRVIEALIVPLSKYLTEYSQKGLITPATYPTFLEVSRQMQGWHYGSEVSSEGARQQADFFNQIYTLNQELRFMPTEILDRAVPELKKLFVAQRNFGEAFVAARMALREP